MNALLFENTLFGLPFITGGIFIITGFLMLKFPPKKINSLYGYRTKSSMQNQQRWDFAQNISSKEMMKLGSFLAGSSLLAFITDFSRSVNLMIGLFLMIAIVVILFIKVERAIKVKFKY